MLRHAHDHPPDWARRRRPRRRRRPHERNAPERLLEPQRHDRSNARRRRALAPPEGEAEQRPARRLRLRLLVELPLSNVLLRLSASSEAATPASAAASSPITSAAAACSHAAAAARPLAESSHATRSTQSLCEAYSAA